MLLLDPKAGNGCYLCFVCAGNDKNTHHVLALGFKITSLCQVVAYSLLRPKALTFSQDVKEAK